MLLTHRFLSETDLPADKIARRVGMSNGDHLAKVFRRNLRLSPLEYRQLARARRVRQACAVPALQRVCSG
jgi:transcriptional regulator GlxA family with amidase domain